MDTPHSRKLHVLPRPKIHEWRRGKPSQINSPSCCTRSKTGAAKSSPPGGESAAKNHATEKSRTVASEETLIFRLKPRWLMAVAKK